MERITRPTIIITSLGRTGTMFFSDFFNNYFDEITAFHEPDVILQIRNLVSLKDFIKRLKWHGLKYVTNKIKSQSLRQISNKRIAGIISKEEAAKFVFEARNTFINSIEDYYYLECNKQFYGLIDILKEVFSHYRVVFILEMGEIGFVQR